jgi:hypothetical protein
VPERKVVFFCAPIAVSMVVVAVGVVVSSM